MKKLYEYQEAPVCPIDLDLNDILIKTAKLRGVRPIFIHIGGPSGVGKSTLAHFLDGLLPDSQVFSVDSYLSEGLWDTSRVYDHTPDDPARPYIGGISPKIWDFDMMEAHLDTLAINNSVQMPIFNETIKDRVGYRIFEPSQYVIVEGGNSFSDRFITRADYKVLVNAPLHDRVIRKIVRTHLEYGRSDVDEVLERYFTKDEPVNQVYENEHASVADQVVSNYGDPVVEYCHLRPSVSRVLEGAYVSLDPFPEYGSIRPSEMFGVIRTPDNELILSYALGDRNLVSLPIARNTLEQMSKYYFVGGMNVRRHNSPA